MNKTCTCRLCGNRFTVTKPKPFCCATCRHQYNESNHAILVGANNEERYIRHTQ